MKSNPKLAAVAALLACLSLAPAVPSNAAAARGQESAAAEKAQKKKEQKGKQQQTPATPATDAGERLEPDDTDKVRGDVSEKALANRREGMNEDEQGEVVYFNNFLNSYRLGPEDVISISVFGLDRTLDRYTRTGIVVPPDGKIDYFHIRNGVSVVGKTTQQVADEITHHLDEYIIEPKVTVSLEKAMSMRYYVIGDVATPGIRVMTRRLSAYEAILESGGVLATGDKKKVTVSRVRPDGTRELVPINIAAIEKGLAPDSYFLSAGDLIIVPGNRYKSVKKVLDLLPVVNFFRIFTGGF